MLERVGIGIDITNIRRFKEMEYKKNIEFYNKIFLKSEIEYCLKFKNSAEHFAGKFAIKESVKKSIKKNIDLTNIVTSHKNNKPEVRIEGENCYKFLVSVSHESEIAIAVVISELI